MLFQSIVRILKPIKITKKDPFPVLDFNKPIAIPSDVLSSIINFYENNNIEKVLHIWFKDLADKGYIAVLLTADSNGISATASK